MNSTSQVYATCVYLVKASVNKEVPVTMVQTESYSLHDLALRLRDLVNRTRRHARLWRGPKRDWHVVTSALDMLQDTAWALETYATEVDALEEDKPHAYIRIFGVLNGLVIQQDAAFLLFK